MANLLVTSPVKGSRSDSSLPCVRTWIGIWVASEVGAISQLCTLLENHCPPRSGCVAPGPPKQPLPGVSVKQADTAYGLVTAFLTVCIGMPVKGKFWA